MKGIQFIKSARPGKPVAWYVYAWKGGPRIMTATGPKKPALTLEAIAAYHEAMAPKPSHTLAGLIASLRRSEEWKRLAATTRRNWGPVLDRIEAKWGPTPLTIWSDPRMVVKVIEWRDSAAATPRAADYRVGVLRFLLEWGRLRGKVTVNVAARIPSLYEGADRAEIIWTADDRAKFATIANQAVTDALELACLTGLRLSDLAGLKLSEIGEHAIVRLALKRSRRKRRRATVPITPELRALLVRLAARPRAKGVDTALTTSAGRAWSADGLGKRIGEARTKAGIAHHDGRPKHLHDCRGTFATVLIEAGLTDQEAADVLAWSPERVGNIRKVYVDQARVVVALAERIAERSAKQKAKQSAAE